MPQGLTLFSEEGSMKTILINTFLQALLALLDGPVIKRGLDALLDAVEDAVVESENRVDDVIVLTLVQKIREELDIPDND